MINDFLRLKNKIKTCNLSDNVCIIYIYIFIFTIIYIYIKYKFMCIFVCMKNMLLNFKIFE